MRALILGTLIAGGLIGSALAQDGPPPPPGGFGPDGAGQMRPRGRLFISPMGEPFHGGPDKAAPQDQWFDGADTNHDGALSLAEMSADAERFFVALDVRKDGEIDPDDVERYETVLAPEIRTRGAMGGGVGMRGGSPGGGGRGRGRGGMGGGEGGPPGGGMGGGDRPKSGGGGKGPMAGGKQGAARFGYLDYPQPITVADRNFNRGVDRMEWAKAAETRFDMLDKNGDGKIEKGELPKLSDGPGRGDKPRDGRAPIPQD